MGVVSPLGVGLEANERSLRAGKDCVREVVAFDTTKCRCKTAGGVEPLPAIGGADWERMHRSSHMMIYAAREVLTNDPAFRPQFMVMGTTSGGMSYGEQYYRAQIEHQHARDRAMWLANYAPQKPLLDAMVACDFRAPVQIIANACASGTNAIGHAFHLIRAGLYDRVLCGGYDAICEMVYAGFDALQASTTDKIRPFDRSRSGLVLGEGAGLFSLEEMESARSRGATIVGEINGYGISTDNHHLTQPHPSGIGPEMAMQRALDDASLKPSSVDYINAHGTATPFNDASEGAAIAKLFGEKVPVSSTKSMMGHALGAAGAIEGVFAALAIRGQFLPPNINFREIDEAWRLDVIANRTRDARVRSVLSNSFGFGGTNASIILSEVAQ
jgi:3-oxoacyl-[acyl-carrier-protein] synthase II